MTLCKGTNGHGEEVWHDGRIVAMSDWELCCLAEPAYDLAQVQEMVPEIVRDGRRLWGWPEALAHYERRTGIPVTLERVAWYRRFYALPMFLFTHHAGAQVHLHGNRLARFAWSSTEMQYVAELRFAAVGGFLPEPSLMLYPDVDDLLASILDTFERYVAPAVDDEYAASLCLTIGQLLRSVRARVAQEGDALAADNAELRALLGELRPDVDAATVGQIDAALAQGSATGGHVVVTESQREAVVLRQALVACIGALPDRDGAGASSDPPVPHAPARTPAAVARGRLHRSVALSAPWTGDERLSLRSGLRPSATRPVNWVCLARGSGWNRQPWTSRYSRSRSELRV